MAQDQDKYLRDMVHSNKVFSEDEKPEPMFRKFRIPALIVLVIGLITFVPYLTSTGFTITPIDFQIQLPSGTIYTGIEVSFRTLPAEADVSLALIDPKGRVTMLDKPLFIPNEPGTYRINALFSLGKQKERIEKIVIVKVNP